MRLSVYALIIAGLIYGYYKFQEFEQDVIQSQQQQEAAKQQQQAHFASARAMFKARCEQSGVFIHQTAEDVEGIFLMKLRPEKINYSNQFKLDDPYGRDLGGDAYIRLFLKGHYEANRKGVPIKGSPPKPEGYHYIEAIDPEDGQRYRYTGRVEEPWKTDPTYSKHYSRFVLDKIPAPGKRPRYGVTYDDISTHEEREYWIAGSSLKVIDLETNEVMAERIGYMMDYGQGSRAGGRSPWLFAADNACPSFQRNPLRKLPGGRGASAQPRQTQDFIEQVLIPKLEN